MMEAFVPLDSPVAAAIGWLYLTANSTRVFTYIPQIVAVWRCRDGARAISLFTWWSWALSNLASVIYGVLVVHDAFFVMISAINFAGSAAVAFIATWRRGLLASHKAAASAAGIEPEPPRRVVPSPRGPSKHIHHRSLAALPRRRRMGRHGTPGAAAAAALHATPQTRRLQ